MGRWRMNLEVLKVAGTCGAVRLVRLVGLMMFDPSVARLRLIARCRDSGRWMK